MSVTGEFPVVGLLWKTYSPRIYALGCAHDADGNLTQDGRWSYEWDAENRLKVMRSLSGSPAPERRLEFEYDAQGRRIRQTVWNDRDSGQVRGPEKKGITT